MIEISKSVIQRGDKYLLLRRAAHCRSYPNLWDFPGGKHDPGETPEQAVIRETKEETSYDIEPGKEVKQEKYRDKQHHLLFHYFIPERVSGKLELSSAHSDFVWIERGEMQDYGLHPSVKLFFE